MHLNVDTFTILLYSIIRHRAAKRSGVLGSICTWLLGSVGGLGVLGPRGPLGEWVGGSAGGWIG